jgi:DNA-binding transcriptional LysR family regulator
MDILQAIRVFSRVVETRSFSKTAESLEMPRPTVTTVIQALEAHLAVRLLNRTTRRVHVTEDGTLYY